PEMPAALRRRRAVSKRWERARATQRRSARGGAQAARGISQSNGAAEGLLPGARALQGRFGARDGRRSVWAAREGDRGMKAILLDRMKIYVKSPEEIAKMREANLCVEEVLNDLEAACRPGVSTWELNEVAGRKLKQLGAESAFLGYHGYPAVLCTSVN